MTSQTLAKTALSKRAQIGVSLLALYALVALAALVQSPRKSALPPTAPEALVQSNEPTPIGTAATAPRPAHNARTGVNPNTRPRERDVRRASPGAATQVEGAEVMTGTDATDPLGDPAPDLNIDQKLADMERQWQNESDDPRWTVRERANTIDVLSRMQVPAEVLRDVRCRSSLCRITVDAADPMRLAGLAGYLSHQDPPVSFRIQDGQAFAYVPRERAARPD